MFGSSYKLYFSPLQNILTKADVVLLMKGSPDSPQCGFSRAMVGILGQQGVQYSHFNILSDNHLRDAIKQYSDWPTYPQLYKNGELVGGLDVVKGMAKAGELSAALR